MVKKPLINLKAPIRYIKGVGPKMAKRLKRINIEKVDDLIRHFPFRYNDYSLISPIAKIKAGEMVTLIGEIVNISNHYTRSRRQRTIQKAVLKDNSGLINLLWFNQPYLKKTLTPPTTISVSGKARSQGKQRQLIAPKFEIIGKGSFQFDQKTNTETGRLVPIYPITSGLTNRYIRKLIAQVMPKVEKSISEFLPQKLIKEEKLFSEKEAICRIHFPKNSQATEKARERLAFDELFFLQLKQLREKQKWQQKQPAQKMKIKKTLIKKFIQSLPFELTKAQNRVIKEINRDLEKPVAMNRLLQGDVGSGKTVVAATAILSIADNQYQSVLMAPTEILAQQHYQNLKPLLKPFAIKTSLITGSYKKDKKKLLTSQLIIGTHALIHRHAQFKKVGLVIIDEQHRFGVYQRAKLVKKAALADQDNLSPHILTMTATPIPRTITLTIYNNLDVSIIDEMPPGRKKVKTYLIPPSKRRDCYQWIKKRIKKDKTQAFIICPLIEESESLKSVRAAKTEYKKLKKKIFPDLKLALLHGRMKGREKEEILKKMNQGKIDILIATSVVEVGIDITNANIIIIEAANRFGLAQLHQLRGRVGRGNDQAHCFLFAEKITKRGKRRLEAMKKTNDGMVLAETDLKIRGPGEAYGLKQHGFPEFKIASYTDLKLIRRTHKQANKLLSQDPELKNHPQVKQRLNLKKGVNLVAPN